MGRLNIKRKLFAPAAIRLVTSLILATPSVLGEVPLIDPKTAQPIFSGLAQFSY